MHHIWFICPSIEGCLGCFHLFLFLNVIILNDLCLLNPHFEVRNLVHLPPPRIELPTGKPIFLVQIFLVLWLPHNWLCPPKSSWPRGDRKLIPSLSLLGPAASRCGQATHCVSVPGRGDQGTLSLNGVVTECSPEPDSAESNFVVMWLCSPGVLVTRRSPGRCQSSWAVKASPS